ncbi:MAG: hypothetical protein J0L78_01440 [Planctomycetes bacterium]|nr:hypothetical protein [Planctomycetota bacterium]
MTRTTACTLVIGSLAFTLGGCNYERLPEKFELVQGSPEPGLTVMYTESMRDPANAKFPPATVRLMGVQSSSLPQGRFDFGAAIDSASKPGGPLVQDVAMNQRVRLFKIPPTDPIFESPYVFAAASLAWAGPDEPQENYVERIGVFDDKGNEISPYVALPPVPNNVERRDRRAALMKSETIRKTGLILEVDREGVKVVPSGLKVREARAVPPPEGE